MSREYESNDDDGPGSVAFHRRATKTYCLIAFGFGLTWLTLQSVLVAVAFGEYISLGRADEGTLNCVLIGVFAMPSVSGPGCLIGIAAVREAGRVCRGSVDHWLAGVGLVMSLSGPGWVFAGVVYFAGVIWRVW